MIPILSLIYSASSKKWVVINTVLFYQCYLTRSQNLLLAVGSRPVVGSSSMRRIGSEINAIAKQSYLFSPPESLSAHFVKSYDKLTLYIIFKTFYFSYLKVLSLIIKHIFSKELNASKKIFSWLQIPIQSFSSELKSIWSDSIDPDNGWVCPVRHFIRVDLPLPLDPIKV